MKIFVVGPESGDFFAHNVAYACREMGHDVCSVPGFVSPAAQGRVRRTVNELMVRASRNWRIKEDKRIAKIASSIKPDLTIICTKTLEPEIIESIRKKTGGLVICWYGDPPANLQRDHITSGEYDAIFLKDKRFANDLKNVLGLPAYHLHEACNPAWHKPEDVEVGNHVAVAGTLYGYRVAVIERLLDNGIPVSIFGPKPSPWVKKEVAKAHTGIFLDHTNKAKEFGRALACLNTFAPAERDSLNCRVFETCGCGGLLLSEHKEAMDECFEPYEEYLPFTSFDELLAHISRAEKDNKLAQKIRSNASRRAHEEHSYMRRIEKIFELLAL